MDDTRGILRPEAVGELFTLDRPGPPADLAHLIEHHWLVTWDLRGRPAYVSEVLPHPSVHLVCEPTGTAVYGVMLSRHVRRLSGRGWAAGTKFRPGGFAPLTGGPVSALTDRVLAPAELFGARGARLQRDCRAVAGPTDALPLVHAFLRERARTETDPALSVVGSLVSAIAAAPPGTRVSAIATAHGISTRTMQRLFASYVGVGPKWVLQRYRLHEAIEQLHAGPRVDWTRFALDLGYYDHAHFLRDFRALVGRSPAQYERETARLAHAA